MADNISDDAKKILHLLKYRRNVLISGSPGTGKSRLLSEVANAFIQSFDGSNPSASPLHVPGASVAIPSSPPEDIGTNLQSILPASSRTNRKIFRTVFHQNSKYREFITGMVPTIDTVMGFKVMSGTLYRASEHGKLADGAALLIIDEINRGPAVQVFGGSIVSIEPEKRLKEDNSAHPETQFFEIIDPNSGEVVEYSLPEHLYILAAMNQADSSVEPLDVAFLRRWAPFRIEPSFEVLRDFLGVDNNLSEAFPDTPTESTHVYKAALLSWKIINDRIRLGRGAEFQIGHGIFFMGMDSPPQDLKQALIYLAEVLNYLKAHIEEVFFGDLRGLAAVLNVTGTQDSHPYKLVEKTFADEPRIDLVGPKEINSENVYALMISIIKST